MNTKDLKSFAQLYKDVVNEGKATATVAYSNVGDPDPNKNSDTMSYKGSKRLDVLHALHKKHKFPGVKFHTAPSDDSPHALTVQHSSPAMKHKEFSYHLKKMPQFKQDKDGKDVNEGYSIYGNEGLIEAAQKSKGTWRYTQVGNPHNYKVSKDGEGRHHIFSHGVKFDDNYKRSQKYKGSKDGHLYSYNHTDGDTEKNINKFVGAVDHAHKNYKVNGPNMHGKRQSEKDHKNPDITMHTEYGDNHPSAYTLHSDKAKKDAKLHVKSLFHGKEDNRYKGQDAD